MNDQKPAATIPIGALLNMNAISTEWLASVGVNTYEDLASRDIFEVWIDVKDKHPKADKTLYYALWGALNNKHWSEIPQAEKDALSHKIGNLHL